MLSTIYLLKYPSFDMRSPQILIGLLRLWLFAGMLLASFSFSVIAQETPITTTPLNTPKSPDSQSGMQLGVQTAQNGNTYLNWIMVPPTKGPSPINSDIEWLADNLRKGVASPPVMMPPAPLPMPGAPSAVHSIKIFAANRHRHSFQIQGRLPTVLSIAHKIEQNRCGDGYCNTSFDIAEGFASNFIVSAPEMCEICSKSFPSGKTFNLELNRGKTDEELRLRGAKRTILWQVIDKNGHKLQEKFQEKFDARSLEADRRTTYNGGNYMRITPLTFETSHDHNSEPASFESFSFYKEIADLAYKGKKGDKVSCYIGGGDNDDTKVRREQPWIISQRFWGHGTFEFSKLEAEIVEVIEGPLHQPDYFNLFTPDYFANSVGLDDDYSAFKKIIHPYCGEIPVDFRAVILRTYPKEKELSNLILAFKGSNFNRSDWIYTDIPQYFGAIPEQYQFSKKVAKYVETINFTRQPLFVVGHSLGGGMAQYVVGTRSEWPWRGYGFNPATLGTGVSAEITSIRKNIPLHQRFTVIQNSNDIVSNAGGRLIGSIWVLESSASSYLVAGHTLGSMDLTRILTVLPAPSNNIFSLNANINSTASSPPLLPGFVNQQFADLDKP